MRVVIEPMDKKTAREIGERPASARKTRVKDHAGGTHDLWSLEVHADFETAFTYVFGLNVAKARRENKRVTGSSDGIAA